MPYGSAWKQAPSPSLAGSLSSVAATSASNVWAVGYTRNGRTLIERWNGTAWNRVSSPSPGASARLSAVAATSARNAWAVGSTSKINHGSSETLILHWNGTT